MFPKVSIVVLGTLLLFFTTTSLIISELTCKIELKNKIIDMKIILKIFGIIHLMKMFSI